VLNLLNAKSVNCTCSGSTFIQNLDTISCTTILLLLNRYIATCMTVTVSVATDGILILICFHSVDRYRV